ncbi:coronin, putative [Plasmodium chabaudi chabaudi]|uniref:Coronin n=1 Tax=Plasmodium chabaudi chabaudi TaxID=31271 RepID=A0A077TS81_PLACU|nr:coronin, putative [Plasmodium chabaudi chabaudi]SCN63760.1 coronin, putative [Plasmodium chabaudi chabaudi]VTZ71340.1 coronin, putative [Plasmodium chabaudi chabaudi]|eukprot:XP_744965.2 coronin, putative [Plasmodium chabaudi chabaudi]
MVNDIPCIKNLYSDQWNTAFDDLQICTRITESCGIACSSEYIATPWQVQGGGVIGVIKLENMYRNPPVYKLKGHTSNILDIQFNPCYNEVIASSSEDMSIRIWEVCNKEDKSEEIKKSLCILNGHKKKVTIIDWNPLNYYILSSSSFDSTVNIWDIENEKKAFNISMPQKLTSLKWNNTGTLLTATCLNKKLHIIDPRQEKICTSFVGHTGGKCAKNIWIDGYSGNENYILSTGFSKNYMREIKLWDLKNISDPISTISIDNASAPLLPHYDESIGIIYVIGKGDGNCRYYQHSEGVLRKINEYKSCLPFKSFGFLPKQVCNIYKCEIGRIYKNENNKSIKPISFYVPRKNPNIFQEDLYPPIIKHDPNYSSKSWINGNNLEITRINIKDLTDADIKIYKKFKTVPKSMDSILIGDPCLDKRSFIIRQFTKRFTFFKKNNNIEFNNNLNISSESSFNINDSEQTEEKKKIKISIEDIDNDKNKSGEFSDRLKEEYVQTETIEFNKIEENTNSNKFLDTITCKKWFGKPN